MGSKCSEETPLSEVPNGQCFTSRFVGVLWMKSRWAYRWKRWWCRRCVMCLASDCRHWNAGRRQWRRPRMHTKQTLLFDVIIQNVENIFCLRWMHRHWQTIPISIVRPHSSNLCTCGDYSLRIPALTFAHLETGATETERLHKAADLSDAANA